MNTKNKDKPLSKNQIDKKVGDMLVEVENRFEGLFRTYEERFDKAGHNLGSQETPSQEDVVKGQGRNGFVSKFINVKESSSSESETELKMYLNEPKLNYNPSFDILKWWKQNEERYPIVAQMTRSKLLTFSIYFNFTLLHCYCLVIF